MKIPNLPNLGDRLTHFRNRGLRRDILDSELMLAIIWRRQQSTRIRRSHPNQHQTWRSKTAPDQEARSKSRLPSDTAKSEFPTDIDLPSNEEGRPLARLLSNMHSIPKLQEVIEAAYRKTTPDYGAFVALDASTGRILSMVSYAHNPTDRENLALRATFPSASVFKVVTAAAAISEDKFSPNTVIPYTGQNHTLYKTNVFHQGSNRWTRYVSLKEAFAKSINTVFGKIGAYNLQPSVLRDYADRFGFNRKIASDVPVQTGRAPIPDDPWGVAQASSGYTRDNTMSPLQGSLIAATVVNNGVMMEPYLVQSVYQPDGTRLYTAQPTVSRQVITPETAMEVRALMRETISHGTCQKTFRGFSRSECALIDVGGKTGTLTGFNPLGKYDWFIGYAEYGGQKIAYASLTIHKDIWRVKSSQIAREAIEAYFKTKVPVAERVASYTLRHRRDEAEQFPDAILGLFPLGQAVDEQRFGDDVADGHARIERGVGVLKDDLHLLAELAHLLAPEFVDALPLEEDLALGRGQEAQNHAAGGQSPEPDSPTRPSVSPLRIAKSMPSTALTSPTWRERIPAWIGKYL